MPPYELLMIYAAFRQRLLSCCLIRRRLFSLLLRYAMPPLATPLRQRMRTEMNETETDGGEDKRTETRQVTYKIAFSPR